VRPGRPYELHILVQPGQFRPGISPQLDIDSVEGGAIGATYYSGRLLFPQDRWKVDGRIAGELRQKLDGSGSDFAFTRATGEVVYEAPPLAGVVRPSLRARAELSDRQRADLHLESFMFATLDGGAYLVFLPIPYIRTALGGGVERRILYSLEPVGGQIPFFPSFTDIAQTRQYVEAALELTFDPESIRRDRHHRFGLNARVYGPPHTGENGALHITGSYQKMFAFGWNELWLELRAVSRTGFVLFPEETSIGGNDFLRGPFGSVYARKAAGVQLEYRHSLLRDVFKIGLFSNGTTFGAIDRVTGKDKLSFANSVGLGLHLLLIDEFQLDAWYGVGWDRSGAFDKGGALAIRQAF